MNENQKLLIKYWKATFSAPVRSILDVFMAFRNYIASDDRL